MKRYWGFTSFRPLQEEIIRSVLEGKDTLALLPTGGGKSLCFQIPALCRPGICIVVSPLISLIKDQVLQLKNKQIKAVAIVSGMSKKEIDVVLDNCIYGNYKFLYVSPERLQTELFVERFKKMEVNLVAVDEAHCISQWGYDFRPPYLQIAGLKDHQKAIPFLALTATATHKVVVDIQEKLLFKNKHVIQKSFFRKNLSYNVLKAEDKYYWLLKLINKVQGSGIVYVRSRVRVQKIAAFLNKNHIASSYYHAGISVEKRDMAQKAWYENKVNVMVATNAFGMGINKPDVKFVIHFDIPDTLESYFQEAGRAGRDETNAYAILLYNNQDIIKVKDFVVNRFPEADFIKQIYNTLGNFYQLASGAGEGLSKTFNLNQFCEKYELPFLKTYNALVCLETEGLISLSDAYYRFSCLQISINKLKLAQFMVDQPLYEPLIKVLLRSYSGVWDSYVNINESELAGRLKTKVENAEKFLKSMHKQNVISYLPESSLPILTFLKNRLPSSAFTMSLLYEKRKKLSKEKLKAVLEYIEKTDICRSELLMDYFGEKRRIKCGICDVCRNSKKKNISNEYYKEISGLLKLELTENSVTLNKAVDFLEQKGYKRIEIMPVVNWMLDNKLLLSDKLGQLLLP